jgi:signal transduction histidine kinase
MNPRANRRTALFSWLFVGALLAVCATLGVLQYRWISEVNVTARDHMRDGLRANLARLSQDFNSEIASASSALARFQGANDAATVESQLTARFAQWKSTARHAGIFDRIGVAIPGPRGLTLLTLDLTRGTLAQTDWPPDWSAIRGQIVRNASGRRDDRGPGGPPPEPGGFRSPQEGDGLAFETPVFGAGDDYEAGRHFGPRDHEIAWVIFNLNLAYVRETMLPELLRRDLGSKGSLDYQVEVVARDNPDSIVFESDPGLRASLSKTADASVNLFEPQIVSSTRRGGPGGDGGGGRGRGRGFGGGRGPSPEMGRWQMYVRHRAGSLEAVMEQTRIRNLSVTAGVLLLMLATAFALLRYTIRAQRLANMQMEFVAGVSHELRTPLTVIHTAGYNLRGKLARNPAQVEQYGAMIQRESARLRDLVEQVLRFSSASAGRVVQDLEPLSVERLIEEALEASRSAIDGSACVLESSVDAGLPQVMGDPLALRHALENLVGNAVKYGAKDGNWIGVFASKAGGDSSAVEIRVADHGPGIPEEEQRRIFDPFFRGARALQDQIHGTGLGLSLVKKIVEAHGGSIRVKSAPLRGTEFIVRIPAAPETA